MRFTAGHESQQLTAKNSYSIAAVGEGDSPPSSPENMGRFWIASASPRNDGGSGIARKGLG
jgi:hypothetical protein